MARRAEEEKARRKAEQEIEKERAERKRFAEQQEPCPFCRSHDLSVEQWLESLYVYCSGCHAEGPHVVGERGAAWTAWNARPSRGDT